jgi:ABC-type transport system substrate-binding protein
MTTNSPNADRTGPSIKIDRVIEKYDLSGMAEQLENRWLGAGNQTQSSTRDLADHFNKEVLKAAVQGGNAFTLSGDVEQVYDVLTDSEDADATLVRSRLDQSGVDVEAVTGDFVSHQTVYRYLTEHLEVERSEKSSEERLDDAIETIQRLQGRTTAVTEQNIQSLKNQNIVSVGEFSVLNDIQVLCENCGRSHDVTSFFEGGGCECAGQ